MGGCLIGGYVQWESCLKGGHVIEEDISYRRMFFWINVTGGYILLEDMYYFFSGQYVWLEPFIHLIFSYTDLPMSWCKSHL